MKLHEAARAYLGVPFQHQGRNPDIGIDCIGLVVLSGRDCGKAFVDQDSRRYTKNPHHGLLRRHLVAAFGEPVPHSEIRPGDVVSLLYYEHRQRNERHVAIVGDLHGLSLIHTNASVKRVTEAVLDAKWRRRIVGVWHG